MVIYADILIFLNTIVNYLLLRLTAKLCKSKIKEFRLILGAFIGGIFSLYIFLPQSNFIIESAVRAGVCAVMITLAFGCRSLLSVLRELFVLFCITFLYAGFMLAVWYIFKPAGLIINNGNVYFNLSPIMLIIFSVIAYGLICIINLFIGRRKVSADHCSINIECGEKATKTEALLDTGHKLRDDLTGSPVVIVDREVGNQLFGHITVNAPVYTTGECETRFRVIPYRSVGSEGILPAFRCEKLTAQFNNKNIVIINPIVAVIDQKINDECGAIINPQILME